MAIVEINMVVLIYQAHVVRFLCECLADDQIDVIFIREHNLIEELK